MFDFDTAKTLAIGTEVIASSQLVEPSSFVAVLASINLDDDIPNIVFDGPLTFITMPDGNEISGIKHYRVEESHGYRFRLSAETVQNAADDKWEEVKTKRASIEYGGCVTPLGRVQTNLESQSRITSTKAFADLGNQYWTTGWTMEDNSVIQHDRAQFYELARSVGLHISDAWSRSQALRVKIYGLDSVEEIEAIDIETAWNAVALTDETGGFITDHTGSQISE